MAQTRGAFTLAAAALLGLPILGFCSETIFLPIHLLGAGMVFVLGAASVLMLARADAARVRALGHTASWADVWGLRWRNAVLGSIPIMFVACGIGQAVISETGSRGTLRTVAPYAERKFFAFTSPIAEWVFGAGTLGCHMLGFAQLIAVFQWDTHSIIDAICFKAWVGSKEDDPSPAVGLASGSAKQDGPQAESKDGLAHADARVHLNHDDNTA